MGVILYQIGSLRTSWQFSRNFLPTGAGIENSHLRAYAGRVFPQVFFEDFAIVIDDESHHAVIAVASGNATIANPPIIRPLMMYL